MYEADKIGYPLMVKAAAGGGGKGMRVVRESAQPKSSLARHTAKRKRRSEMARFTSKN